MKYFELQCVDRNSLAGIVRAHEAAEVTGIRLIVGCRLDLAEGMSLLAIRLIDRPMRNCVAFFPSARSTPARPSAFSNGRMLWTTARD